MSHLDEGTLHALLDGEIPSSELAPIQAHLAACAECRARLDAERGLTNEALALVEALELPAGTGPAPGIRAPRRRPWRELAWAASLVAAAGLGYVARGPREVPLQLAQESRDSAIGVAPVRQDSAATGNVVPTAPPQADLQSKRPVTREGVPAARPVEPQTAAKAEAAGKDSAVGERKAAVVADAGGPDSAQRTRLTAAPPAVAMPAPQRQELGRLTEQSRRMAPPLGNPAPGIAASRAALTASEPISFPDAIRRLGGSLRLIEGMIPLRVEAQGPFVSVIYPAGQLGELVLRQQLIDGRVFHELIGPAGFPADSLARLKARVRE